MNNESLDKVNDQGEMDTMKVIQEEDDIDFVEAIEDQATTPRFKFGSNSMVKRSSNPKSNDQQTHSNDGKQSAHGINHVGTFEDQIVLCKSLAKDYKEHGSPHKSGIYMGNSSCAEKFEEVSLEQPPKVDSSAEKFSYLQEQIANEDFGTPKNGLKRANKVKLDKNEEAKLISPRKKNLLTFEETPSKRSSMPKSFIKESIRRFRESSLKKTEDSPTVKQILGLAGSEDSFKDEFRNQIDNDLLLLDEIRIPFKRASVASVPFDLNNSETRKNYPETPTLAQQYKVTSEVDDSSISHHSIQISQEEVQQSETSTNRDVSMVLNHSILSEEDFLVDLKQTKPRA